MTYQLIELASVDGAGKSTVGRGLAKAISAHYYYSPPEKLSEEREEIRNGDPENSLAFYTKVNRVVTEDISKILPNQHAVVEPYHLSTLANHNVTLKRDVDVPEGIIIPDQVIYLTAEWEEIERRLTERGEARKAHENLPYLMQVAEQYDRLIERRDDVIRVDTTGRKVEETVDIIFRKLVL